MKATVVSQPINATVSASGGVSVSVSSSQAVSSTASGGVGPPGPAGPQGQTVTLLDELADVVSPSPEEGEVLRYVGGVWRDQPGGVNGGNF